MRAIRKMDIKITESIFGYRWKFPTIEWACMKSLGQFCETRKQAVDEAMRAAKGKRWYTKADFKRIFG
jgi:hypothetical protein